MSTTLNDQSLWYKVTVELHTFISTIYEAVEAVECGTVRATALQLYFMVL
jgi:hypothetical protein